MTPRRGLPLAAQLLLVILAGLFLSNALFVALAFTLPPPDPPLYRITEIAAALRANAPVLAQQGGFQLETRTSLDPTGPLSPPERLATWRLAQLLDKPLDQIRFQEVEQIGPMQRQHLYRRREHPPSASRYEHQEPVVAALPADPRPWPPQGPDRLMRSPGWGASANEPWFRVRRFEAAVQQADGRWLVLRPKPEAFPNPWQLRLMIWMMVCVLTLSLVAWLFARRLTAPIAAFGRAAEALGRDPASAPLVLDGPAEIGQAAAAFNQMRERLQLYIQDRTLLLAALAHDLRTPLTRLRFRLEQTPEPERAAALSDIAEMEAMVTGVMAFMKDATQPAERRRLDLASLVEAVVDDLSISLKGISMVEVTGPIGLVEGDPVALRRLLANLISNAVQYGGAARVACRQSADTVQVIIEDEGPGLEESERERVFEPFYRVDRSRSRETGGMGLGLSVVRAIARAHGGDVTLTNRKEGGLAAVLTLPTMR